MLFACSSCFVVVSPFIVSIFALLSSGAQIRIAHLHIIRDAQAVFDFEQYTASMQSHNIYRRALNEWRCDPFYTIQPNIPIHENNIIDLMKNSFVNPHDWIHAAVIAVESITANPSDQRGSLRRISPEEPFYARVLRIKEHNTLTLVPLIRRALRTPLMLHPKYTCCTQGAHRRGRRQRPARTLARCDFDHAGAI